LIAIAFSILGVSVFRYVNNVRITNIIFIKHTRMKEIVIFVVVNETGLSFFSAKTTIAFRLSFTHFFNHT